MRLSEKGIKHLSAWEGARLFPYDDQTGLHLNYWNKNATIGIGHLIHEPEWEKYRNGITQAHAIKLLSVDVEPKESTVNKSLMTNVNQNQYDALVILCFNIGSTGFVNSSVRRIINDPVNHSTGYNNLELAWKAWNKSNGKINRGLINRRLKEWSLYNEEII